MIEVGAIRIPEAELVADPGQDGAADGVRDADRVVEAGPVLGTGEPVEVPGVGDVVGAVVEPAEADQQERGAQLGVQFVDPGGSEFFWQVAGFVELGTTAHLEGIVLTQTAVTLQTGASVNGRLLAQTAVNIDASDVVPVLEGEAFQSNGVEPAAGHDSTHDAPDDDRDRR